MNSSYLVRATALDGRVRAFALHATDVVRELQDRHGAYPAVSAALLMLTPIYFLVEKYLSDKTATEAQAAAALIDLVKTLPGMFAAAGLKTGR